jgi:hypothetical protein
MSTKLPRSFNFFISFILQAIVRHFASLIFKINGGKMENSTEKIKDVNNGHGFRVLPETKKNC